MFAPLLTLRRLFDWRRRIEVHLRASVLFPAGDYELRMYRMLRWRILCKALAALVFGAWLYSTHLLAGQWLQQGVAFMQFHEVFRFELPAQARFDQAARLLLTLLLARYGLEFLWRWHSQWFSALVYERGAQRLLILQRRPFREDLLILPRSEIVALTLRRGWLDRLSDSGELEFTVKAGVYTLRSLHRASELVRDLG